jgi:hypothetical protein
MPFRPVTVPYPKNSQDPYYYYKGGRPFLFTVAAPTEITPLYDLALALYVNPNSVDESMSKSKSVTMTYGGYVEFHWPDELDTVSASGSTGGFLSPAVGYTAASSSAGRTDIGYSDGRRGTMAYERYYDFLELFRNNGNIYDGNGKPVIRGRVIMMYDRGTFVGHFTSFDVTEEDSAPYVFTLNWEFKVENTLYKHNFLSQNG